MIQRLVVLPSPSRIATLGAMAGGIPPFPFRMPRKYFVPNIFQKSSPQKPSTLNLRITEASVLCPWTRLCSKWVLRALHLLPATRCFAAFFGSCAVSGQCDSNELPGEKKATAPIGLRIEPTIATETPHHAQAVVLNSRFHPHWHKIPKSDALQ